MKVFFVGAGPGDPELLTMKAWKLLKSCHICVYAGSLVNPEVLHIVPKEAKRHNSAAMSLKEIVAVFLEARDRGIDVIRLHSGDPSIYGAIREQMNELDTAGIAYEVVPGISAFQASAALLQIELTAPEVAQTVILTRTSGRTPLPEEQGLEYLARTHTTLCIFLSGHKIDETITVLIGYYGADCPAAVVYHASWPDEKSVKGTLGDIAEKARAADMGQTSLILVGRALSRDIPASKLYDPSFSHGFREGDLS